MSRPNPAIETTVLLVDDDNTLRNVLGRLLSRRGYRVIEAVGARPALRIIEAESVDIIVSDIQMSDGDGFELIQKLRASESAKPPLIFMSGGVMLSDAEIKALGAALFLQKLVSPSELLSAIAGLVSEAA